MVFIPSHSSPWYPIWYCICYPSLWHTRLVSFSCTFNSYLRLVSSPPYLGLVSLSSFPFGISLSVHIFPPPPSLVSLPSLPFGISLPLTPGSLHPSLPWYPLPLSSQPYGISLPIPRVLSIPPPMYRTPSSLPLRLLPSLPSPPPHPAGPLLSRSGEVGYCSQVVIMLLLVGSRCGCCFCCCPCFGVCSDLSIIILNSDNSFMHFTCMFASGCYCVNDFEYLDFFLLPLNLPMISKHNKLSRPRFLRRRDG